MSSLTAVYPKCGSLTGYKFSFTGTVNKAFTQTSITATDAKIKITDGTTPANVACDIPAKTAAVSTAETLMTCTVNVPSTNTHYAKSFADTDFVITGVVKGTYTEVPGTKIQGHADYIALHATQPDATKAIDYTATEAPYSFVIKFEKALPTSKPAIKSGSNTLECAVNGDKTDELKCTIDKEKLPGDKTDKTKKVTYPIKLTNACGSEEDTPITISVNSVSMISFSKLALLVIGLLLF